MYEVFLSHQVILPLLLGEFLDGCRDDDVLYRVHL